MKRNRIIAIVMVLLSMLLPAQARTADGWTCPACGKQVNGEAGDLCPSCGYERHAHDWAPATCLTPKTCKTSGETEGQPDPDNHEGPLFIWDARPADACRAAGYTGDVCCEACGRVVEQGHAIPATGHDWQAATRIAPKTCRVCGKTEGEPLPALSAGEIVTFGRYEQDNHPENGAEPVAWQVLEVDESNGKALLISRYGLDAKPYHEEFEDVAWDACSLRKWLNEDFLLTAFTETERNGIPVTEVDNSRRQGKNGAADAFCADTQDRIFLLSYAEANRYFGLDEYENDAACAWATPYALAQGALVPDGFMAEGIPAAGWWLRVPAYGDGFSAAVCYGGSACYDAVTSTNNCVRPALWIDLASGLV